MLSSGAYRSYEKKVVHDFTRRTALVRRSANVPIERPGGRSDDAQAVPMPDNRPATQLFSLQIHTGAAGVGATAAPRTEIVHRLGAALFWEPEQPRGPRPQD
jgi:hypothetical protein